MNPSDSQPQPQPVTSEAVPQLKQLDVAQLAPAPEQAQTPSAPEQSPAPTAENTPVAPASAAPATPAVQAPVTPPVQAAAPVTSAAPAMPGLPVPATANDDDVIEKEWVDKTEEVITRTAADPYAEEEAIEALQVEYLKKRYDHDVKKSS